MCSQLKSYYVFEAYGGGGHPLDRYICPVCHAASVLIWLQRLDETNKYFFVANCMECGVMHKRNWNFGRHRLAQSVVEETMKEWRKRVKEKEGLGE